MSIFFSWSLSAQKPSESREKIKALKIAYLTEQLNLTTTEAEKFWPIYNAHDKEHNALRYKMRTAIKNAIDKNTSVDNISEKEAQDLIQLKLETDKKIYQSQSAFISNVKKVLSYKKIMKLQVAEMEFGRKLMRKYKRKRKE
ncbi:sensor of ECF-type sigma factor [Polaribacter sp. MED152]|uniref:sensor of ECF-type sigma factor n=1 Tax=Polaribacter sp. MED152 TaxID=313598 RepID=UPI0011D20CAB|nr:sensor of ECF-type sigma factor [Polaribacter sp. MED152]